MNDEEERSDTDLLLTARTSAEPFGVFYERHFASVLAFFRRRTPGPEEAFDLTAETFAAALAAVPRFEPGPEPARAWLFAIARHKLSESLRKGRIQDEAWRALGMLEHSGAAPERDHLSLNRLRLVLLVELLDRVDADADPDA